MCWFKMTEEQEELFKTMLMQNQEVHDFWFKPATLDHASRAVQLDKILSLSRGTTFFGKALMMLFGVVVTVATTWAAFKALMGIN